MNKEETIPAQVDKWRNQRRAASFEVECKTEGDAREMQKTLQISGHKGIVTRMGTWIGLVLYLIDNPKL